jgi:hypothetical protein
MFRLILAIVSTVTAVVFVSQQSRRASRSRTVRVRVFLLMLTFLAGLVTSWLAADPHVRWKRRVRDELRQERAAARRPSTRARREGLTNADQTTRRADPAACDLCALQF